MKRVLLVAALAMLLLLGSGCCAFANLRYWRVLDLDGGRTYYIADTNALPLAKTNGAHFVSTDGKFVKISRYELEPMSRAEWEAASRATAEIEYVYYPGQGSAACGAVIKLTD